MAKSATKDMTVGSPMKLILSFSMPLLIGFIFQQFYSVVDTFIVGRTLGMNALAGVGATGSINFLIVGFVMGVCGGCVIPIAQRFGAKDYSDMRRYVANCVWLGIVMSVVITVVVCILCRDILMWMKTPEDIFEYSYQYIFIVFLGIPATYLYNILSGIMRSMGNSKIPLVFLIISSAINIALDLICIINLHMGVSGAAVATVASQLISGILCLIYMMKKFEILHITKDEWKISMPHIGMLCAMGVPMGLQYSITAIGSVILQSSVNTLGATAVAAVTAGSKVNMFFCCAFDALGTTMATYGGQNVGAKKLDRLGKGLFACSIFGIVYSIVAFIIMYFAGGTLCGLFVTDASKELLDSSREFLLINAAFFIPLVFVNVIRYMIQGMGFSTFAILSGVFEMIARTLMGIFIVPVFGFTGACFASPLAWIMADIFLVPAYFYVKRKLERTLNGEKTAAA